MNPGWISAGVVALLQFASIIWWAATTHADRRHASNADAKRDKELDALAACTGRLEELLAKHDTRLTLIEDRQGQGRRLNAR